MVGAGKIDGLKAETLHLGDDGGNTAFDDVPVLGVDRTIVHGERPAGSTQNRPSKFPPRARYSG